MKTYWELIISFFKTGLFTFGGGLAMLPIIKAEVVDRRKWITEDELFDFYAISQCTPGIIIVNVATFCGCKLKGFTGGLVATLAVVAPSILIITLIAAILSRFMENPYLVSAFAGIRLGVCALLLNLIIDLAKKFFKKNKSLRLHIFIFGVAVLLIGLLKASAIYVVLIAGTIGFFSSWKGNKA